MGNSTIIYTIDIRGHYLEYIHHVYDLCRRNLNNKYIFIVPWEFDLIRGSFTWEDCENVVFDLIPREDFDRINNKSLISKSLNASKYLRKKIKEYQSNKVLSLALISLLPFVPFYIPKKCHLSGIIYMIYLNNWEKSSLLEKVQNVIKYFLMSYSTNIKNVYILNDANSASRLNSIYKVRKYVFIPDPYVPLKTKVSGDIRDSYAIDSENKLFVHFGAMNLNKGTIEILESLKDLSEDEKKHYVFFFAGIVDDEIKERFCQLVNDYRDEVKIIVKNEFCSYDFIASLCSACNAILIPYKRTAQSSGLIGYASQFNKPVIAPAEGLLGKLVKKYDLGILVDDCTPQSLIKAYRIVANDGIPAPTGAYCDNNSVDKFQKVLNRFLI